MIPLIFAIGIIMGSIGGILMKVGASHFGKIQIDSFHALVLFFAKMFTDITVLSGMTLYFLSAVVWLYLLTKLEISLVQPILALTYVITPILAIIFLGENVPPLRWIGIGVVIIGVFLIARSAAGA